MQKPCSVVIVHFCRLCRFACSVGVVLQTWRTILIATACSFGAALEAYFSEVEINYADLQSLGRSHGGI